MIAQLISLKTQWKQQQQTLFFRIPLFKNKNFQKVKIKTEESNENKNKALTFQFHEE